MGYSTFSLLNNTELVRLRAEADQVLADIKHSLEEKDFGLIAILLEEHAALWTQIYRLQHDLLLT
jgi:hypothetical protein